MRTWTRKLSKINNSQRITIPIEWVKEHNAVEKDITIIESGGILAILPPNKSLTEQDIDKAMMTIRTVVIAQENEREKTRMINVCKTPLSH
jgi:virulence-associated protein VagC